MKNDPPSGREKKLLARGFGRRGEWAALGALLCKRYRVLARNFASAGGEIDLVVMKGETIAFVEVKARPDVETARTAISFEKRRRIVRATRAWIGQNKWSAGYNLRGDAVFISPRRWPEHLENAFELDLF